MNEIKEEIIEAYKIGISISQLLKEYPNWNRRQITQLLIDNGITIRGGRKKKTLSEEQIKEIQKMIDKGTFLKDIAEYCHLDIETMKKLLKENNQAYMTEMAV